MNGFLDICQLLLEKGADINCKLNTGHNCIAAQNNRIEHIQLFLDFEIDIESKTNEGATSLFIASYEVKETRLR